MKRALSALLAAAVIVLALGPAALADPKSEPLFLACVGVPSGEIVAHGNGQWTPGFDLASNGMYIPYAFEFSFWFTPEGSDEEVLVGTESVSKRNVPRNAKKHPHGVCTFGETFPVEDDPDLGTGTGRFVGTAWVFYTG